MALYGPAIKLLLPENTSQPAIRPIGVIVHTNASNGSIERLLSQYQNSDGEAHFQLETGVSPGSHRLAQYMDTNRRADNNYQANSFVRNGELCGFISIETADLGSPYTKSWSDLGQRQQLEDLLVWLCRMHGIPPRRPADPWSPGIGYHCMWGFNNRNSGSGTYGRFTAPDGTSGQLNNPWTNTYGKICPGPSPGVAGGKIGEFDTLLAAVALRVAQGDDMPLSAADAQLVWDGPKITSIVDGKQYAPSVFIQHIHQDTITAVGLSDTAQRQATEASKKADATAAKLDEVLAAIAAIVPGEGGTVDPAAIVEALRPVVSDEVRTALSETVLSVPTDT